MNLFGLQKFVKAHIVLLGVICAFCVTSFSMARVAVASGQDASYRYQIQYVAQAANQGCGKGGQEFFGLPTWYKYLDQAGLMSADCTLERMGGVSNLPKVIVLIAMAILDIALRIAGLVAVAYVFYGGIRYVTSHGEPAKTKEAQESLINALTGLVIALAAVAAVSFIGSRVAGA